MSAGATGTPLTAILARRIAASGPITLADYMSECLLHPAHGYYATREPFGASGDFITAPEISQMFGELMGLALAQSWLDQGAPSPFTLAEIGPGRGTLMADILRATRHVPGFHTAMRIVLVEASARLRDLQRQRLADHVVNWADHADALPRQPLFLIANEFFDALPIRQFRRQAEGWCETMITLRGGGASGGGLGMALAPASGLAALQPHLATTSDGDIVEICPAAGAVIGAIAARIAAHGGVALLIDYGNWGTRGDTFQALRQHRFADPLAEPGLADLTAHVDFRALAEAAREHGGTGINCSFTTQGAMLSRLGIAARSSRLAIKLSGEQLAAHLAATRRLTDDAEMGSLFKVLALYPNTSSPPPGAE
jgi:NADH dehydrogenase [ubiquinone] 1 alpha subcomplex assembly factor 7